MTEFLFYVYSISALLVAVYSVNRKSWSTFQKTFESSDVMPSMVFIYYVITVTVITLTPLVNTLVVLNSTIKQLKEDI